MWVARGMGKAQVCRARPARWGDASLEGGVWQMWRAPIIVSPPRTAAERSRAREPKRVQRRWHKTSLGAAGLQGARGPGGPGPGGQVTTVVGAQGGPAGPGAHGSRRSQEQSAVVRAMVPSGPISLWPSKMCMQKNAHAPVNYIVEHGSYLALLSRRLGDYGGLSPIENRPSFRLDAHD